MDCANSTYGCCPDGIISAEGPNFENCGVIDSENCTLSQYGCCPDGITPGKTNPSSHLTTINTNTFNICTMH